VARLLVRLKLRLLVKLHDYVVMSWDCFTWSTPR